MKPTRSRTVVNANGNTGIYASLDNGLATGDVMVDTAGNVTTNGVGIYANNNGFGNVTVQTEPGQVITSTNGDGIDAFANGGNVTVTLLDGSINSNHQRRGSASFAGSDLHHTASSPPNAPHVSGGDPRGIWASTNTRQRHGQGAGRGRHPPIRTAKPSCRRRSMAMFIVILPAGQQQPGRPTIR